MKLVILSSLVIAAILPVKSNIPSVVDNKPAASLVGSTEVNDNDLNLFNQSPENEKMLAVIFRNQHACRAELKDFEFDVQYKVVSATVYFSGTSFRGVETGFIKSNSLDPVKSMMLRCVPGSMVVFDNVKVIGPDSLIRPIQGTSYLLH